MRRVLSGWSVSPYRARRLPRTARTRVASGKVSKAITRWSRRLASYSVGTFPSAPPRTGRAPFGAPGSPVSSAADDPQYGFGVSHLAYLPARVSGHLPPFPVWTAFPSSEYYGGSVALRPAARRAIPHSRGAGRIERDGGASFAPLNGMMSHRPPRGRFERRRLCRPIAVAPP